jgi:hypothetical protein
MNGIVAFLCGLTLGWLLRGFYEYFTPRFLPSRPCENCGFEHTVLRGYDVCENCGKMHARG